MNKILVIEDEPAIADLIKLERKRWRRRDCLLGTGSL